MKISLQTLKTLILLLLISNVSYGQSPEPFNFFIYGGLDPNMLISGAYPDRQGSEKTKGFDYKAGIGFDWENTRLRMEIQSFEEIHFTKWTYMAFDYKLEILPKVYAYAGLEVGQIKRKDPLHHLNTPEHYREYVTNPLIFGANAELQYRLGMFGLAIQANIHQAEDKLKPYKKYRKQVHGSIFFYF